MKAGVDIGKEKIFLELGTSSGLSTTVDMSPKAARLLAEQLMASAKALEFVQAQDLADNG